MGLLGECFMVTMKSRVEQAKTKTELKLFNANTNSSRMAIRTYGVRVAVQDLSMNTVRGGGCPKIPEIKF
ncbi:hypothetical protein LQZ18_13980 [Lachnospiraceae bacterium ZAX-1]